MNDHYRTSKAGIELIATFEGCRLRPYKDIAGVWTVGYGHTGPGTQKIVLKNVAEAKALLAKDLKIYEEIVKRHVHVRVSQLQFDALVSIVYNAGSIVLDTHESSLARHLNAKHFARAANHFLDWDKATVGGRLVTVTGLLRRRRAERALFLRGSNRSTRISARAGVR